MNRLQELKEEFAKTQLFDTWNRLKYFYKEDQDAFEKVLDFIANMYAEECVKASLEKASENAEADHHKYEIAMQPHVVKSSVTNPENIILL